MAHILHTASANKHPSVPNSLCGICSRAHHNGIWIRVLPPVSAVWLGSWSPPKLPRRPIPLNILTETRRRLAHVWPNDLARDSLRANGRAFEQRVSGKLELVSAIHQLFLGTTDQRSSYFYKSFSQQAQPNKTEAIQKFLLQLGGDDIILWSLLYRSREGAGSSQLLAQGAIRGVCRALRNTSHCMVISNYGLAVGQSEDSTPKQGSPNLFEIKSNWTGGGGACCLSDFLSLHFVASVCLFWRLLACSVFRRWMTIQYKKFLRLSYRRLEGQLKGFDRGSHGHHQR